LELSSPRFKALAVTAGATLWFFIITSAIGMFSLYTLMIFVSIMMMLTQIFSLKLSRGLDIFAIANTKIFTGTLFVLLFSIYGILFKMLRIDLLRLKKQQDSYWLQKEQLKSSRIFKQY